MKNISVEHLISAILSAMPDCQAIYRFGSWGTASQRSESDIDLAVLPAKPLDSVHCWDLAQSLASLAGRDVDLIDLLSASTVFRMQIISKGKRLYCADVDPVEKFENSVFSSYAKLNEERREILADIQQRRNIYGK